METFILLSLATWRLSSLLAREEGPFNVFAQLRHVLGVQYNERNEMYGMNWFARGVICVWCNSLWFSLIAALFMANTWYWYIICWLAISAAAVVIDEVVT